MCTLTHTHSRSEQSSLALCLMRSRHAIVCAASAFAYTHSVAAPAGSAINASNLRCVGVSFALALPLSLLLTLYALLCAHYTPFYTSLLVCINFVPGTSLSLPSLLHVLHAQVQRLVTSTSPSTSHSALRFVIVGWTNETEAIKDKAKKIIIA